MNPDDPVIAIPVSSDEVISLLLPKIFSSALDESEGDRHGFLRKPREDMDGVIVDEPEGDRHGFLRKPREDIFGA